MSISKEGKTGPSSSLIDYLLRELDAEIIGGTFYGDKRTILAQSGAWNRLHPNLQANTAHLIESYPPGELVSDQIINFRVLEKLKRLGFEGCPYLIVKHTDKEHYLHVHILASRIRIDGSVVDDSNLARRAIAVTKELDAEFGMRETPFYFRSERVGRKEYEMMKRTGEDSQNQILRNIIQKAAQTSEKSFEKFLTNLEQDEVGFWLYLNEGQTDIKGIAFDCQKTGHLKGISGSGLGTGFGFPKLSKQIGYDKVKDFPKLIEKYQLKPKSEIQPKAKKSKPGGVKETYILVSHTVNDSIKSDDQPATASEKNLKDTANDLADSRPIEMPEVQVENPFGRNVSQPEVHAAKTEAAAEDFPLVNPSPESIAESENLNLKIAENEYVKSTEPVKSEDALAKDNEIKLFYKKDGEDDDSGTTKDKAKVTVRFVKFLQDKIDAANDSAASFSGFLQNLQHKRITCLPEIDDDRRVFDFVFIKKGIAVSSGELGEGYKFHQLAHKLDYPDKPIFAPQMEDENSFRTEVAALRDKPLSEYWWKMTAKPDDEGRVAVSPAAFAFMRVTHEAVFQVDVENFEDSFRDKETADKFL